MDERLASEPHGRAPARALAPTAVVALSRPGAAGRPPASALAAREPDLVDRMFDYLSAAFPQIAGEQLSVVKSAVRAEFRGEEVYIPARGAMERQRQVAQVLSLFNGRNAADVARQLGISRSSVYRFIKQGRLEDRRGEG